MKINEKRLKELCLMDISEFFKLYDDNVWIDTETGNPLFIYIDNNSDILGVAHLDVVDVGNPDHFARVHERIYAPNLDDRLGVYMLLHELKDLDFDILLTIDEEIGNSSAQYFKPTKKYNWVFEFDRSGADVVLYQYRDFETAKLLREYDFKVGYGAFSDISELEHLECKCFNIGCGYHGAHTAYSYFVPAQLESQTKKFRAFYADQKDTRLKHEKSKWGYNRYDKYNNYGYSTHNGNGYNHYNYEWGNPANDDTLADARAFDDNIADTSKDTDSKSALLCEWCLIDVAIVEKNAVLDKDGLSTVTTRLCESCAAEHEQIFRAKEKEELEDRAAYLLEWIENNNALCEWCAQNEAYKVIDCNRGKELIAVCKDCAPTVEYITRTS